MLMSGSRDFKDFGPSFRDVKVFESLKNSKSFRLDFREFIGSQGFQRFQVGFQAFQARFEIFLVPFEGF